MTEQTEITEQTEKKFRPFRYFRLFRNLFFVLPEQLRIFENFRS